MRMFAIDRAFCHDYDFQLILDTLPTCTAHTNDGDYDLGDRILDYRRSPSLRRPLAGTNYRPCE
jgi:hypothetical protein